MSSMVAVRFINHDETCRICEVRDSFVLVRHEGEVFAACPDCIEAHAAAANGEGPVDMDAVPAKGVTVTADAEGFIKSIEDIA